MLSVGCYRQDKHRCSLWFSHLLFVPALSLSSAAVGDVLVLRAHFRHDGVHVQVAAVVHLHDDRGVLDLALQLTQLLGEKNTSTFSILYITWC